MSGLPLSRPYPMLFSKHLKLGIDLHYFLFFLTAQSNCFRQKYESSCKSRGNREGEGPGRGSTGQGAMLTFKAVSTGQSGQGSRLGGPFARHTAIPQNPECSFSH